MADAEDAAELRSRVGEGDSEAVTGVASARDEVLMRRREFTALIGRASCRERVSKQV